MTTMAVTNDSLRQQLQAGADALALGLTDAQITLLMDFLALLQKWNKVYNLTSVRDPQEMMTHHLLGWVRYTAGTERACSRVAWRL